MCVLIERCKENSFLHLLFKLLIFIYVQRDLENRFENLEGNNYGSSK
jgi:hypothetical protein